MASVTFTAVLPNGETASRTTKTRAYVACLAIADKGGDNWGARSWHLTRAAAIAANSGYISENYNAKVLDVEITKVVGKTLPGTELHDIKAALAAGVDLAQYQAGLTLGDVAPVEEPLISADDIDATSDALGELFAEGTKLVADALAEVREEIAQAEINEAVAAAKADTTAPAKMSLAQKRELGTGVHDRIRSVLDALPAGIDPTEAAAVVETWLLYIPKNRTEESSGMTADQKRELGSAVRALAEEALAELPVGVAPASALTQLDTWFTYIPQSK